MPALKFWNGSSWVTVSGGGVGLQYPDAPPDSPSAYDDEFEGGSLDAKWTEIATPSATGFVKEFARHGSWLAMPNPGAAANQIWDIRQAIAGAAAGVAWQVTARLAISGWTGGGNARVTVSLGNDAAFNGGSYVNLTLSSNGGVTRLEIYDGAFDVQNDLAYPGAHAVLIHAQRDTSNNVRIWVSLDGFSWRMVHTQSRAWDIAYLFVRLIGHNSTGSPSVPMVDWVRVNDSRFTMPVP